MNCCHRASTRILRTRSASGTQPSNKPGPLRRRRFTGFRGFEWTSDRFGHINVYFSRNDTNAKIDGGYATMRHVLRVVHDESDARRRRRRSRDLQPPRSEETRGRAGRQLERLRTARELPGRRRTHGRYGGLQRHRRVRDNAGPGAGLLRPRARQGMASRAGRGRRPARRPGLPGRLGRGALGEDRHPRRRSLRTGDPRSDARTALLRDPPQRRAATRTRLHDRRAADGLASGTSVGRRRCTSRRRRTGPARWSRSSRAVERSSHRRPTASVVADIQANTAQKYYFMRVREGAEWTGYSSPIWVTASQTAAPRDVARRRPARPHVLLARRVLRAE